MPDLHPTAVVDRNADLADDVRVGPYSIIGPKARIGPGTRVGAHCIIERRTTIGRFNRISHHACLGGEPQDLKFRGEDATLEIGDHNDIREFVTMHVGTENGGSRTTVGSHNLFMVQAHVAHDCHVRDHCILSNNVMLAGHIEIQDHAIIAGGAAITHYATIGRYAFVGGLAGVVKDCPPFLINDGHPAHARGTNTIGLTRHKFQPETIERIKRAYAMLYGHRSRRHSGIAPALEEVTATLGDDPLIAELTAFIRRMIDAPNGRAAEVDRLDNKRATPTR